MPLSSNKHLQSSSQKRLHTRRDRSYHLRGLLSASEERSSPCRAHSKLYHQDLGFALLLSQAVFTFAIFNAGNKDSLYRPCNNNSDIVDETFSNAISILSELSLPSTRSYVSRAQLSLLLISLNFPMPDSSSYVYVVLWSHIQPNSQ